MVLPVFVLVTDAGAACAGGEERECADEGGSLQRKREKALERMGGSPHSVPQAWRGLLTYGGSVDIAPHPFLLAQAMGGGED